MENKEKKLYNYGFIIGRFQPLHKGHLHIIESASKLCNHVVIFIGSSQESHTLKNPFTYDERRRFLTSTLSSYALAKKQFIIRPLPDISIGNNEAWGKYVLNTFIKEFGCLPDLYISGAEKERSSWFSDDIAPAMDELRISRKGIEISASEVRECLYTNNPKVFNYLPEAIYTYTEQSWFKNRIAETHDYLGLDAIANKNIVEDEQEVNYGV